MSDELDDFTGTGTALSYPVPCSTLKKGSYVVIQERPCKITDMSTSRKDEHGRIKIHLVGIDIFTGNIDDGFLSLKLPDGSIKKDIKLPESELGETLKEELKAGKSILVSVGSAMGEEYAVACKDGSES